MMIIVIIVIIIIIIITHSITHSWPCRDEEMQRLAGSSSSSSPFAERDEVFDVQRRRHPQLFVHLPFRRGLEAVGAAVGFGFASLPIGGGLDAGGGDTARANGGERAIQMEGRKPFGGNIWSGCGVMSLFRSWK